MSGGSPTSRAIPGPKGVASSIQIKCLPEVIIVDLNFAEDARELMEQFIASFPAAIRESYRARVLKGVEYQMLKRGLSRVSKDVFMDGLCESFPKSFEPLLLRFKDPEKLTGMMAAQKKIDEKNPLVKVRRWAIPSTAIG